METMLGKLEGAKYRPRDCDSAHHSLNTAKRKYCRLQIHPSRQSPILCDTGYPQMNQLCIFFLLENSPLNSPLFTRALIIFPFQRAENIEILGKLICPFIQNQNNF